MPLFDTVLVANRGEIARRVIRTLHRLGIRAVAVYSDADADAPHVREADESVRLGPAEAARSYLDIDAVIAAARTAGAQAVHPGYGFLSENAAFGAACEQAGLVFIGPGRLALETMADKIRARDHVAAHGVPVVPGFSAAGMTDDEITAACEQAGYPILIKPSAGGGGKGMQEVYERSEIADAVATARRVARAAFGDDTLLFERLISHPRHIEVQVIGDAAGHALHLGERECTLQRRHQKVVEESPSPLIDAALRERLGAAACAAADAVDYRGAGTVEFIVSADRPDEFFFMEMNTRLQVEHPVTELVTGLDLVELQLRVAAGQPLGITQADVSWHGHAVEARVYAERPAEGFLPATGRVLEWAPAAGVRTDAAVETGSTVTADYDPMIAKVIAYDQDRGAALAALDAALRDTVLFGVESNIAFLRTLLADPAVQAGTMDTGLIDRMPPFAEPAPSDRALRAAAARAVRDDILASTGVRVASTTQASSLWRRRDGWRLSADAVPPTVSFAQTGSADVEAKAVVTDDPGAATAVDADGTVWVHADGVTSRLEPLTRREADRRRRTGQAGAAGAADPDLHAPMPGSVVAVHVGDGDAVEADARIVTVEAMKMEHALRAPHAGTVRLHTAVGDQVRRGQVLARVEPTASDVPTPSDRKQQ